MKRICILTIVILFSTIGYSQVSEDEPQNVIVNWKVGTSKKITQIDSTIVYTKDSLLIATGVKSSYTIDVVSLMDTVYEVRFKQLILDDDISIASDIINTSPLEQLLQDLIIELQKRFAGLEYSFFVSKNTAFAFEVKNEEELRALMEEMVLVVLNQLLDDTKVELEESKMNQLKLGAKKYMDEQMPAIMQTMLNTFNYIFQAYSFPFIIDKTYSQEIDVSDIDEIDHGDKEIRAELLVNSHLNGNAVVIDYEYIYDKNDAYQMYIVSEGREGDVSFDEFDIDERVIAEIDLETSWILSSLSLVNAKMGEIIVRQESEVIIK
jgi:hypothetical protein